jgi:TIR domain
VPEKSYDVFLSHSTKDKKFVRTLAEALKRRNLRVWYDESNIRVGDTFLSSMGDALEHSRYFVVVVSPEYLSSSWANFELGVALGRKWSAEKAKVLPIFLAGVDRSALPPPLSHTEGVDAKDWPPERIAAEVADLVAAEKIA